jgi:tetratricopeptide (TPR) repeat protein
MPSVVDSVIKLGSLLVDTDEIEEAGELLDAAADQDPLNVFIYLHKAELLMNINDLSSALDNLRRAQSLCADYTTSGGSSTESPEFFEELKRSRDSFRCKELASNISSLLSVALFRADPTNPEVSISPS